MRYGGAVSRRVVILDFPRPLTTLFAVSLNWLEYKRGPKGLRWKESRHCAGGCETVCCG